MPPASTTSPASPTQPGYTPSSRPISATARGSTRSCAGIGPTRSCIWPPKAMSTARSTGRAPSSTPISPAPSPCSRRRAATGRHQGKPAGFRFHHISTDEVFGTLGADGTVHRGHALRAELALFGIEGGVGPSGAGLARDLWPAGGDDQLLEQLRAVPFPGKADPGGDPERAGGRADPGLRAGARTCATGCMSRIMPTRCWPWC